MRRYITLVFATFIAAALSAGEAAAQWQSNGVPLSGGNSGTGPRIVSDGASGSYVAWQRGQNSGDVYLQRVTAGGSIAPGWPVSGLPIAATPHTESLVEIEPDGQGGVFVAWADFYQESPTLRDCMVQRIQPDGTPVPGWLAGGVRISVPERQDPTDLAADGGGGVYVVWQDHRDFATSLTDDIYALHLLADGSVTPGWPADGLPIAVSPSNVSLPVVVPDGAGGALFVWNDDRDVGGRVYSAFGSRVHADGNLASGWVSGGRLLAPEACLGAISDATGGLYLLTTFADLVLGQELRYYLRRIAGDGTPAPGWPTEGLLICDAPGNRTGTDLVPDGQGGALVTWYDYRSGSSEIFALRVLPGGTLAPGWTVNGTRISDPANLNSVFAPKLVDDGAGGAYVVWGQRDPALVQHLTASGQPAPGWPATGLPLATSLHQRDPKIASDGAGGAIVAWSEGCCGRNGIWAQRFVATGIVATQLSLVSASTEADRVKLDWAGAAAAGLTASVYRRGDTSPWAPLARISADGTGHLRFDDHDVRPGERYAYRLGYYEDGAEQFTGETWIEVPAGFELALAGFRPNPASGSPLVSFTLPRAGPGRLELFDLAGRRVADRDLAGLPAGRHTLRLGAGADLPPAAYLIRLTHAASTRSARGVVVR